MFHGSRSARIGGKLEHVLVTWGRLMIHPSVGSTHTCIGNMMCAVAKAVMASSTSDSMKQNSMNFTGKNMYAMLPGLNKRMFHSHKIKTKKYVHEQRFYEANRMDCMGKKIKNHGLNREAKLLLV